MAMMLKKRHINLEGMPASLSLALAANVNMPALAASWAAPYICIYACMATVSEALASLERYIKAAEGSRVQPCVWLISQPAEQLAVGLAWGYQYVDTSSSSSSILQSRSVMGKFSEYTPVSCSHLHPC